MENKIQQYCDGVSPAEGGPYVEEVVKMPERKINIPALIHLICYSARKNNLDCRDSLYNVFNVVSKGETYYLHKPLIYSHTGAIGFFLCALCEYNNKSDDSMISIDDLRLMVIINSKYPGGICHEFIKIIVDLL